MFIQIIEKDGNFSPFCIRLKVFFLIYLFIFSLSSFTLHWRKKKKTDKVIGANSHQLPKIKRLFMWAYSVLTDREVLTTKCIYYDTCIYFRKKNMFWEIKVAIVARYFSCLEPQKEKAFEGMNVFEFAFVYVYVCVCVFFFFFMS